MTQIAEINPSELAKIAMHQTIDLIDVRTPVEYESVHAVEAVNYPLDALNPNEIMASRKCATDDPVYLICKMGGRSRKACEAFVAAGFTNVVNVATGTDGWVRSGLPSIKSDKKVMALDRQVRIAAGSLVVLGTILGWQLHPACYALSAFIGAGLVFSGVTDTCGMGTMISKMPWNRPRTKPNSKPAAVEPVCDTGG